MSQHDDASIRRLHATIHQHRDSLTPTEQRIAAYLLEHSRSVVLLSVQELAAQVQSGPASIIRVLQKLGYKGIAELKKDLKRHLRRDLSPLEQFAVSLDAGEDTTSMSEVEAIGRQEARNISATLHLLDEVIFRKAVEALCRARIVYLAGVGVSAHLAGLAGFVLQRIGLPCFPLQHTGLKLSEQLVRAGKGDALLVFSFPPYAPLSIEAAAAAHKQGVKVVAITNQPISPVTAHADVVLIAKSDTLGHSNSVSAPMVLVHALAAAAAGRNRSRSLKAMKATLSVRESQ